MLLYSTVDTDSWDVRLSPGTQLECTVDSDTWGACFSPVECTVDIDTMVPACLQWLDLSVQLIETHGLPACLLL